MRRRRVRQVAAAIAVAAAGAVSAQAPDLGAPGWKFRIDNDYFALRNAADRWYTNGIRFGYVYEPRDGPGFLEKPAASIGEWTCDGCLTNVGLFLGQDIFTPNNIVEPAPQPDDRPWAGWLYLGGTATYTERLERSRFHERQQSFELILGVIGPAAGADLVQTNWHEIIGAPIPQGWSNQLKNEPTLQASYVGRWRLASPDRTWDLIPHVGGSLGSPYTLARAGLTARGGANICGFGAGDLPLRKSDGAVFPPRASPDPARCHKTETEWYFFARGEARAVAWNTFLDGGIFRAGPSVDRGPFVLDGTVGLAVRFLERWRVTYAHTVRTPEFNPTPPGARGAHRFGTIVVEYEYR